MFFKSFHNLFSTTGYVYFSTTPQYSSVFSVVPHRALPVLRSSLYRQLSHPVGYFQEQPALHESPKSPSLHPPPPPPGLLVHSWMHNGNAEDLQSHQEILKHLTSPHPSESSPPPYITLLSTQVGLNSQV